MIRITCAALLVLAATALYSATDKLDPEEWLRDAEAAYEEVTGYTAVFHKQQRVAGKLLPEETIFLKYRKPSSLYMKWIKAPNKGSEVLYVAGWNDNRIRAHSGGILRFITRNLDPRHPGLMEGNLRPVTSTGIGYLLAAVGIDMRKAIKVGELTFAKRGEESLYGTPTQVLEVLFPKDRAKDYEGRRFVIDQAIESRILIRIKIYDRGDQLVESYSYENLNLDAALADHDFDPKHPDYRF